MRLGTKTMQLCSLKSIVQVVRCLWDLNKALQKTKSIKNLAAPTAKWSLSSNRKVNFGHLDPQNKKIHSQSPISLIFPMKQLARWTTWQSICSKVTISKTKQTSISKKWLLFLKILSKLRNLFANYEFNYSISVIW